MRGPEDFHQSTVRHSLCSAKIPTARNFCPYQNLLDSLPLLLLSLFLVELFASVSCRLPMSNNLTFRLSLSRTNCPSSFVTLLDSRKSRSRAETGSLPARIACHGLSRDGSCLTMAAETGVRVWPGFRSQMPGSVGVAQAAVKNRWEFKYFGRSSGNDRHRMKKQSSILRRLLVVLGGSETVGLGIVPVVTG
jgi:hypothetical protein